MTRKTIAVTIGLLVWLASTDAFSQPAPESLRFKSAATCTTAAGNTAELSPGSVVFPGASFDLLETELERLQTTETRLTAENSSLRASAAEGPGWGTLTLIVLSLTAGIAVSQFAF